MNTRKQYYKPQIMTSHLIDENEDFYQPLTFEGSVMTKDQYPSRKVDTPLSQPCCLYHKLAMGLLAMLAAFGPALYHFTTR